MTWNDVCSIEELHLDRGVAVLVDRQHVALFRTSLSDEVFALSNYDPFSKASVLSRGIVGSKADVPKVASPVFKQNFDLRTGLCIDNPEVAIPIYPVRVVSGRVEVAL